MLALKNSFKVDLAATSSFLSCTRLVFFWRLSFILVAFSKYLKNIKRFEVSVKPSTYRAASPGGGEGS